MQNLLNISPTASGDVSKNIGAGTKTTDSQSISSFSGTGGASFEEMVSASMGGVEYSSGNLSSIDASLSGIDQAIFEQLKQLLAGEEGQFFADFVTQNGELPPELEGLKLELDQLMQGFGFGSEEFENGVLSQSFEVESFLNDLKSIQTQLVAYSSSVDDSGLINQFNTHLSNLDALVKSALKDGGAGLDGIRGNLDANSFQGANLAQFQQGKVSNPESDGYMRSLMQGYNASNDHSGSSSDSGTTSLMLEQSFAKTKQQIDVSSDATLLSTDRNKVDSLKASFSDIQSKVVGSPEKLYSTTVPSNVFDPEWSDDISQKIVWMTSREIKSAEIHLNPAELGPIDVRVSVQNDSATVNINAQNATVREMLESQVVRLREMMEQNGVELEGVNVGSQSQEEQNLANRDSSGNEDSGTVGNDEDLNEQSSELEEKRSDELSSNLVDYYA